jgi:hypothetical protein
MMVAGPSMQQNLMPSLLKIINSELFYLFCYIYNLIFFFDIIKILNMMHKLFFFKKINVFKRNDLLKSIKCLELTL